MSVASSRVDGDRLLVTLREGGEASFPRTLVARIDPDEVPYPDPAGEAAEAVSAEAVVPVAAPGVDAAGTGGTPVRGPHRVGRQHPRRGRSPGARRYPGRVQLPAPRAVAEGRQGPDAAHARHGPAVRRPGPVRPRSNIEAGVRHLKDLLSRFDLGLALAAYNAGEATVRRYGGVPPFAETRGYVSRILRQVGR
ncbi:MAG: lytic transglycosylase domain-containing protein [Vicinamibacterales bacterium]